MSRPGDLEQMLWGWSVPSVLIDICDRAGIPFDRLVVDKVEGTVDGFSMSCAKDAYSGIEMLCGHFLIDPCSLGDSLAFVPRGEDPVAELTSDDVVLGKDKEIKYQRQDSISVPRVLHLEYLDTYGGLTSDKQTSDRSLDARAKSEVMSETTVIMRTADAARSVVIRHKLSLEEQRGEVEFSLPDSWCWLTCGDVVMLDGQRLRINAVEIEEGQQNYKCAHDRKSAYGSVYEGVPIIQPEVPPTLVVGPATVHFIDCHILRDSDDALGYYMAVSSESGAVVELSLDGGATYIASTTAMAWADMGELTEPLAAHARDYPDTINTLAVKVLLPDSCELEGATLAGMQSRLNLAIVGDELLNFGDVDEVTPGVWELSHLLRGRKGTTPGTHAAGTRFVVLRRDDLYFISGDLFQLGRTLTFRTTPIGGDVPAVASYTFIGRSQIERQPAYLSWTRSGGNITLTWHGVGRLGGGSAIAMGGQFAGYRVTVDGVPTDTTAQTLTVSAAIGVTVSVQQINLLTGAGPAITVIV